MTIFVSVASYRDPELVPTLKDCIGNARWPGDLRFGVCWQHAPGETAPTTDHYRTHQVRVLDIPFTEARGVGGARSRIQCELFAGEDFYLQIDSHHRFVQDWDGILIEQYRRTGIARAVLSTYAAAFDPDHPLPAALPQTMRLLRIEPTGVVLFLGSPISRAGKPMKARFVSGHFLFSIGSFVEEVPYDPDLYFEGEEMTMALRAYTHGYDLLHPSEHIIWHEYGTGKARPKHWDDHTSQINRLIPWYVRDGAAKGKVRQMLMGLDVGPLGLGTARNIRDYEAYSGLDFTRWTASAEAFRGDPPV